MSVDYTSAEMIAAVTEALPLANKPAVDAIIKALTAKLNVETPKQRTVYAVWTNTDLTEGRGREYVQYLCEKKSTALRKAKKNYVMGTDSRVTEEKLFHSGYAWYGPVNVIDPSQEDLRVEAQLDAEAKAKAAKEAAIEKAKSLGLSDADIKALKG
jgi:cobalamin biosynthesis Mg chelatase CobN